MTICIGLYDSQLEDPTAAKATALARYLDMLGLSPAGQQQRRWRRADPEPEPEPAPTPSRYRHLRVPG